MTLQDGIVLLLQSTSRCSFHIKKSQHLGGQFSLGILPARGLDRIDAIQSQSDDPIPDFPGNLEVALPF